MKQWQGIDIQSVSAECDGFEITRVWNGLMPPKVNKSHSFIQQTPTAYLLDTRHRNIKIKDVIALFKMS